VFKETDHFVTADPVAEAYVLASKGHQEYIFGDLPLRFVAYRNAETLCTLSECRTVDAGWEGLPEMVS
jgi:hypothetical protein